MEYNFAKVQARRAGRHILITRLILIGILVALAVVFMPTPLNLYGPYAEFDSADELSALLEAKQLFVQTETDEFFDTGYVMTEDNKDKYYYYAFWAGDQYVLCRTGLDYKREIYRDFQVQGKLVDPDSDEGRLFGKVAAEIAVAQGLTSGEAKALVAPYIIYQDFNRLPQQLLMGAGILVALLAVFSILKGIRGMVNYRTTKSFKKLAREGYLDADSVNEAVSAEIAQDRVLYKSKGFTVTGNWVAHTLGAGYEVWPKRDVVWVYRTVTQHRTNGIPSGKSYSVQLGFAGGKIISVTAPNDRGALEMLDALNRCDLQAVFGYSKELQTLFTKHNSDFVALARQPAAPEPTTPENAPA